MNFKELDDYKSIVRMRMSCFFQIFSGGGEKTECYIYGNGQMGKFVYDQLKPFVNIAGFLVSQRQPREEYDEYTGLKIYELNEVGKDSYIIIASLLSWSDIYRNCKSKGYAYCCNYEEIAFLDNRFEPFNEAFQGMAEGILNHQERYKILFHRLTDMKSKKIFEYVVNFRLNLDITWTEKAFALSVETGKQYLDRELIAADEEEVFLDCGGYLGETVLDFNEYTNGKYHKIYFFEPDNLLMASAKENLNDIPNITYLPSGVGEKEDMLYFDAVGDLSGNFSDQGTEKVRVVAIDDIVEEAVTFIKMDIEGMELAALKGARRTISTYKPKMAISVYHKSTDMVDIEEFVLGIRKDYQIYLRHYTKGCADTVMYFI